MGVIVYVYSDDWGGMTQCCIYVGWPAGLQFCVHQTPLALEHFLLAPPGVRRKGGGGEYKRSGQRERGWEMDTGKERGEREREEGKERGRQRGKEGTEEEKERRGRRQRERVREREREEGKGRREGEREKRARNKEKGGRSTGNHNKHIKTAIPAVLINMATQQYLWLATDTTPHTDPHNTRATRQLQRHMTLLTQPK